jgi:TPR repeat protein
MIRFLLLCLILISSLFADYFRDATIAYKNGKYKEAIDLFDLSIKKENCVQGYFYLGKIYLYGEGVDANPSQAIPYLEQAVMKGNVKAKCYLAEAYIKTNLKHDDAIMLLSQGAKETVTCKEIAANYNISLNN